MKKLATAAIIAVFVITPLFGCNASQSAGLTNLSDNLTEWFEQIHTKLAGNESAATPSASPQTTATLMPLDDNRQPQRSALTALPSSEPTPSTEKNQPVPPLAEPSHTPGADVSASPSAQPSQQREAITAVSPSAQTSADTFTAITAIENTAEEILALLAENDRQISDLSLREEQLKYKYRNGEISLEDYLALKSEIALTGDELSLREAELELQLYTATNGITTAPAATQKATAKASPSAALTAEPETTVNRDSSAGAASVTAAASPTKPQTDTTTRYAAKKQDIADRKEAIERRREELTHRFDNTGKT